MNVSPGLTSHVDVYTTQMPCFSSTAEHQVMDSLSDKTDFSQSSLMLPPRKPTVPFSHTTTGSKFLMENSLCTSVGT